MNEFSEPEENDRAEMDKLGERMEPLEDVARKIGLYVDRSQVTMIPTATGMRPALYAEFSLGKVAFTERVQNPEQEQIDRVFNEMTFGLGSDEFLDGQQRVQRNLDAGRLAFDDGDE